MKKQILLSLSFVLMGLQLFLSPVAASSGQTDLYDTPDALQEEIPRIEEVDLPTLSEDTGFPTSFDLRDQGNVSPVKNQSVDKLCWAFSSIAAVEGDTMAKDPGAFPEGGYSEDHLAYYTYQPADDAFGNLTGDSTVPNAASWTYTRAGGSPIMAGFTLMQWKGVSSAAADTATSQNAYTRQRLVTDFSYMTGTQSNLDKKIKQFLSQKKPLAVTLYYTGTYYNSSTAAYYYPGSPSGTNHAVTLVGWDDAYSRENFKSTSQPSSDGAWIAKNSYGSDWGENGYFYISYENIGLVSGSNTGPFGTLTAFDTDAWDTYDYNYQYDGSLGYSQYYLWKESQTSEKLMVAGDQAANLYEVQGNPGGGEKLKPSPSLPWAPTASIRFRSIQMSRIPLIRKAESSPIPPGK